MFINKINGLQNHQTFKGYQHKIDDFGDQALEFNFPYDHTAENCYVEIFKVKRNDKALGGYDVIENKCLAREKLSPTGTTIKIQEKTNLDPDEAFAYRIVKESLADGKKTYIADTGLKIYKDKNRNVYAFDHDKDDKRVYEYTLVSRKSTKPLVQGAGLAVFPDTLPGFKIKGFKDPNTGEITYDPKIQKDATKTLRTYSNKFGGSIAGLIAMVDYMQDDYLTLFSNPFANGDDLSSHHYWNKNNFRISKDMGSLNDFRTLARKLFQNGKRLVFDYTFMGEGLEGINFQHAMRWKGKDPDSAYLFRMNENVTYGIIPKNHENLRFKVINPMETYEQTSDGQIIIKENLSYNPNKETYFQIYDDSQVTEEQRRDITQRITAYELKETENELAINSHEDTIVPFAFEIDPKAYSRRLQLVKELNEKEGQNIQLNSAEGTKVIAQFDNLKLSPKVETGTVNFDANTDLIKKRHDVSSYDEKNLLAIVDENERAVERAKREVGARQAASMDIQTLRFWMQLYKDANILYTAKTIGSVSEAKDLNGLISGRLLPKQAKLSEAAINNIKEYDYLLKPKGIDDKDTVTVRNLMSLPLESLELAENTLGVLARPYFSHRAKTEDQLTLTRFELMEMENPHLTTETAGTYVKVNELFINEIKDFADEVIKTVNQTSPEKLIDEDGEYTEYGEYVMELLGQDIARYAFLKAIAGNNLESKIRKDGYIEYNVEKLENTTSLKGLGIKARNPKEEAAMLEAYIADGMQNLTPSDVKYVASSISKLIKGTNTLSFQLAEAMVAKSGLGMGGRLDAAKDVMDNDAVRDGGNSMDDSFDKINAYYSKLIETVKSIDPHVPIIAEFTDISQLYQANYNASSQVYGNELIKAGGKYINAPDGMAKVFNESGITSEAAYSYFFTDLVKPFTYDFESGSNTGNASSIKNKISELLRTRNIDYIRNLYTFLSNHDKPRILQGLAIEQPFFYTDFQYGYRDGKALFNQKRNHREATALILNGVNRKEDLPIEARLNMDNPAFFKRVSTEALAMADLIRKSAYKNLDGIATEEQLKQISLALKDLANGVYLGKGEIDELQDISIPELSSLKTAFEAMISLAEEKHALKLTPEEKAEFIKETLNLANNEAYVSKFVVRGGFDWSGPNNEIGLNNRLLAQTILDKEATISESGKEKATKNANAYNKYSLYTTNLIGLLKTAMLDTTKGQDPVVQTNMFAAMKDFLEKYDNETVEASKSRKLFKDDLQTVKANAFGAKDIRTAIQMVIKQIEYKTGKEFKNKEQIIDSIYLPAIEPAVRKMHVMTKFLAAVVGSPYVNLGDDLAMTGGERKARNLDLQNRNAIPLHLLEEASYMGTLAKYSLEETRNAMKLRNNPDTEPLNAGTPYEMNAGYSYQVLNQKTNKYETKHNTDFPAYLTQASNGEANIVIMDTSWIKPEGKVVYDEYPEEKQTELEYLEFTGGTALAVGTVFMSINPNDKAKYIVQKIREGVYGIVKEGSKTIKLDKGGVTVLKKIAFRARNHNLPKTINSQYNFVSNPYKQIETPVEGEKLSLIAR